MEAARFTNKYIRLVGQAPAPSKCILLSTSVRVRGLLKDWALSGAGDKWTVKLDTRDLGRHLDTSFRRRNTTLAGRVLGLLTAVLVVMALPLGFVGKLRVLRTKFLPGALHAIEGSRISFALLQRLLFLLVGLRKCLWLMLVRFCPCWMGLLVVILGSTLSGAGFGFLGGTWLIVLWRLLGFTLFLGW